MQHLLKQAEGFCRSRMHRGKGCRRTVKSAATRHFKQFNLQTIVSRMAGGGREDAKM